MFCLDGTDADGGGGGEMMLRWLSLLLPVCLYIWSLDDKTRKTEVENDL